MAALRSTRPILRWCWAGRGGADAIRPELVVATGSDGNDAIPAWRLQRRWLLRRRANLRGDLGNDPLGVSLRHALDKDLPPGRLPGEGDLATGHRNAIVTPSRHLLAAPTVR
jgi:hypothetical protein